MIEEIIDTHPKLKARNRQRILESMLEIIDEEGSMPEKEIKERTEKMISVYLYNGEM